MNGKSLKKLDFENILYLCKKIKMKNLRFFLYWVYKNCVLYLGWENPVSKTYHPGQFKPQNIALGLNFDNARGALYPVMSGKLLDLITTFKLNM